MPIIHSVDKNVIIKLVAGNYKEQQGAIKIESEQLILWGNTYDAGKVSVAIPKNFNAMLYLIKGQLVFPNEHSVEAEHLVIFQSSREISQIAFNASKEAQFLLLAGQPIGEDVTISGPFVMNTHTEILEAVRDANMGKMGVLIEDD